MVLISNISTKIFIIYKNNNATLISDNLYRQLDYTEINFDPGFIKFIFHLTL